MAAGTSQIFYPDSLVELFALLSRYPDAVFYAGGTELLREQSDTLISLPPAVLSLGGINELKLVEMTDRFLEIGSCVTLSSLLKLGEKALPEALLSVLALMASEPIRNLATIGGNLACGTRRMDLFPVLNCLDAQIELKRHNSSRWIGSGRLVDREGSMILLPGEIISRLRIPHDSWDINLVRKVGDKRYPSHSTAVFCFLAKTAKGLVSDIRIAFAGGFNLRNREMENSLVGKGLPFSRKDTGLFLDSWRRHLASEKALDEGDQERFFLLLEWGMSHLG